MMKPKNVFVLVACEESQEECKAFREKGFTAFSCDIQPVRRGGNPDWHIQGDVSPLLHGQTSFCTQSGLELSVPEWNLIIAHPPCTYLCKVGSIHMIHNGVINPARYELMLKARAFFFECYSACADFVAVENPIPMARARLPRPDCFIQPYWYGHKYSKKTLYWLRNLPPLMPEITNPDFKGFVRASRGKYRSRTFEGVARAMADQWGRFILDELEKH